MREGVREKVRFINERDVEIMLRINIINRLKEIKIVDVNKRYIKHSVYK